MLLLMFNCWSYCHKAINNFNHDSSSFIFTTLPQYRFDSAQFYLTAGISCIVLDWKTDCWLPIALQCGYCSVFYLINQATVFHGQYSICFKEDHEELSSFCKISHGRKVLTICFPIITLTSFNVHFRWTLMENRMQE